MGEERQRRENTDVKRKEQYELEKVLPLRFLNRKSDEARKKSAENKI